jgi:LysR family transcriptional activator of nhaA
MINLNYLRYFYICSQCGTFTKAAEKLNISQPSLSMQIKNFEGQLGFSLFIRAGRTLQLTPRGQGLFVYASKIFDVTDDVDNYLKNNQVGKSNSLKIGVSDEVERPFVADLVGRMIRVNSSKALKPSIISKKHDEIIGLAAREGADLVLTNQKTSQLKLIEEYKIPVMLVSANLAENQKNQTASLQTLFKMLDQDLILPTDEMILAKETFAFMKQRKVDTATVLTSNILACIIRATQEKLGAAFLPIAYVNRELQKGSLQAFGPQEGFWQHSLYLYTYKGNTNVFIAGLAKILRDLSVLKFRVHEVSL